MNIVTFRKARPWVSERASHAAFVNGRKIGSIVRHAPDQPWFIYFDSLVGAVPGGSTLLEAKRQFAELFARGKNGVQP
jgi:hypothetical protein